MLNPHRRFDRGHILRKIRRLPAAQRIARLRTVVEIHAARLLQIEILRGQIGQDTGNDVEGEQRLHGDVVPHAPEALADRFAAGKAADRRRIGAHDRRPFRRDHQRWPGVLVHDDDDDADITAAVGQAHVRHNPHNPLMINIYQYSPDTQVHRVTKSLIW